MVNRVSSLNTLAFSTNHGEVKELNMTNNDILRRLRYCFNLRDQDIVDIFASVNQQVTKKTVESWLKQDEDEAFLLCEHKSLAKFLDGFIKLKRGSREEEKPVVSEALSNNVIFRKLKIALSLKAEDVLDILSLVDFRLSKHELSALFRKKDHKNYRQCQDQVLRNFLTGLQHKFRPSE